MTSCTFTSAAAAPSFTKISITVAGVLPMFLNPCGVPFSIKNAWPDAASTGFAEPIVISSLPEMGIYK